MRKHIFDLPIYDGVCILCGSLVYKTATIKRKDCSYKFIPIETLKLYANDVFANNEVYDSIPDCYPPSVIDDNCFVCLVCVRNNYKPCV